MDDKGFFGIMYSIKLMARDPIVLDWPALTATLSKRLGPVRVDERTENNKCYLLEHYPVAFQDFTSPARLVFYLPDRKPETKGQSEATGRALRQSARFEAAEEVYRHCNHSLHMANILSGPLHHRSRREIVVNGLLALLESTAIDLIHWAPTEQMLSPDGFREDYSRPEALDNPTVGFLNVRRFAESDGDMLIDTLGLNAFGLADFQIHFRGLEPDAVAEAVHWLGVSAFEKGDVIEDGDTVIGVHNAAWKCRREVSRFQPQREVIDLYPGKQFAGGNWC